jgi:tetratricopeptide (TPR) repeat protein
LAPLLRFSIIVIIQGLKGNYYKAIPFFDKALDIDPKNVRILRNKAFALDFENAQECYQQTNIIESG